MPKAFKGTSPGGGGSNLGGRMTVKVSSRPIEKPGKGQVGKWSCVWQYELLKSFLVHIVCAQLRHSSENT